ncbi:MAG: N-acetylmuramoyl-L-alanine amidase [Lachnospiraceae bacterium]|nr:N-acetylmuramoyl-L-alanine amidase [Lachnospiraceae bacterium]
MEEQFQNRGNLIKVSFIIAIIASVLCFSVMLAYASQKTIIVNEEDETDEASLEAVGGVEWAIDTKNLSDSKSAVLKVFIPSDTAMSDVTLGVRYDRKSVSVKIKNTRESYFVSDPPRGNYEHVKVARGIFDGRDTTIVFELDETCTCEMNGKGRTLELKFKPVSEIEHPVVMVDAGHGGYQGGTRVGDVTEKNVTLSLASMVRELSKNKPYTVLLTREDDEFLSTQERIDSIEAVGADYYIGIHLSADVEDTKKFGMTAYYNPLYYHNGLENAEFADILLRSVATAASDKALGVFEAGEEEAALKALDIPSAYLYAGYLSNADEAKLLKDKDYLYKIAQGIVEALDTIIGSGTSD